MGGAAKSCRCCMLVLLFCLGAQYVVAVISVFWNLLCTIWDQPTYGAAYTRPTM